MARREKSLIAFLDTHIVCWLFMGRVDLLSAPAIEVIETGVLTVSPIVALELSYLHEIERITQPASAILSALEKDIGLTIQDTSLVDLISQAQLQTWTRDPFDRMIVAHAAMRQNSLLSKDALIREHYNYIIW